MFDSEFYASALPEMVLRECSRQAGCTPVVQLHLLDSTVLEVCDVLELGPAWLSIAYHRAGTCTGADFVFLPYASVTRASVSLHAPQARRLGFRHTGG